ncbi:RNA binding motif protein 12B gene 3 S homeolog [Xenopus laevis]|uniref:MGC68792 protein n=1 Tax=Xenopus laevis TaxID=8355 RepID=Q6PAF0_XENLA|nr:RNA binding motif protein 12B gene 3 S homeolog [Xenopus laevis]AAH60345.1 MGC68792 protein [Xenopus laevis]
MAVVIRLQGLPVTAGSNDIRHFFSGLHIPDGGVHITGGKYAEAFIIFATDEDARRAMRCSGGFIKKSQIELFLSSKAEMQHTLEMNRKGNKDLGPSPNISKLLNVINKGIYQKNVASKSNVEAGSDGSGAKHKEKNVPRPKYQGKKETRPIKDNSYGYVFLCGLPYSTSELDVKDFFHGFHVVDVHFSVRSNGARDGNAYVKFASVQDAKASLSRDYEYIGHRRIAVKLSTEHKWIEAGGPTDEMQESAHKTRERSSRFSSKNHSSSRSPKTHRTRSRSPHNQQFYLHLLNMSYSVERRDIKLFFGDPDIPDSQIKFLLDRNGDRTREGFMLVKNEKFYQKCLGLHKGLLNGCEVWVYPIARKDMLELIESTERQQLERNTKEDPFQKRKSRDRSNLKRCMHLRNFPFNVNKSEVQKFFAGFQVDERDIFLLYDSIGVGLGEALVIFPSEHQAILAEGLNQQIFLGTEVLLRRISEEQMKKLGAFPEDHNKREPKQSTNYRDEYQETGEMRFGVYDYGHGSYDQSRPYRADDFGHGSGSIRRSTERLRSPYDMNQDEHYGRFPMGNQNVGPVNRSRSGGASIRLKNVPYTATIENILDFFYGYNMVPDSVEMDYISKGTAIVHMENYDVAVAAVNELNERPIGPRKVHMSLIRS